jgi:hypothetical protein
MTQLYEVSVSKILTTTLYVYGDDPADAHDDALAIQEQMHAEEFEVVEVIVEVEETYGLPDGEEAWSGGPVGDWVTE